MADGDKSTWERSPSTPVRLFKDYPEKIVRFQLQMHTRQKKGGVGYRYVVGLTEAITCGRNGLNYGILEGML